jgi:uncharacterized Zn-finger protein
MRRTDVLSAGAQLWLTNEDAAMGERGTPRFHNDSGVAAIHIGVKEFKCIGATPPFDHPHVYLDMGAADEIVCPYCATIFRHDASLGRDAARPPEALYLGETD